MTSEEFQSKRANLTITELAELLCAYSDGLTEHSKYMFGQIHSELEMRQAEVERLKSQSAPAMTEEEFQSTLAEYLFTRWDGKDNKAYDKLKSALTRPSIKEQQVMTELTFKRDGENIVISNNNIIIATIEINRFASIVCELSPDNENFYQWYAVMQLLGAKDYINSSGIIDYLTAKGMLDKPMTEEEWNKNIKAVFKFLDIGDPDEHPYGREIYQRYEKSLDRIKSACTRPSIKEQQVMTEESTPLKDLMKLESAITRPTVRMTREEWDEIVKHSNIGEGHLKKLETAIFGEG